jgi:ankyrin repeat protein
MVSYQQFQDLLYQAQCGNIQLVKEAVEKDPGLAKRSGEYNTTLLYFGYQYPELATFLLDHGSDINIQVVGGTSILMNACQSTNFDIVEFLLKKGANPHIKRNDGKTAILLAAEKDNYEVCKLLRSAGANF